MTHRWQTDTGPPTADLNDPRVDVFAYEHEFHNGPRCADCGLVFCEHCEPGGPTEPCANPVIDVAEVPSRTALGGPS